MKMNHLLSTMELKSSYDAEGKANDFYWPRRAFELWTPHGNSLDWKHFLRQTHVRHRAKFSFSIFIMAQKFNSIRKFPFSWLSNFINFFVLPARACPTIFTLCQSAEDKQKHWQLSFIYSLNSVLQLKSH